MQAIRRTIHDRLSHGMTSAPVKYSPRVIGQHRVALMNPSIVNVNATIGTGGSPMILRNMTYTQSHSWNGSNGMNSWVPWKPRIQPPKALPKQRHQVSDSLLFRPCMQVMLSLYHTSHSTKNKIKSIEKKGLVVECSRWPTKITATICNGNEIELWMPGVECMQMQWDLPEHQQIAHAKSPTTANRRKPRSSQTVQSRRWRTGHATIKYTNTTWSARADRRWCNDSEIVRLWSPDHEIPVWYCPIFRQDFRCNCWRPNVPASRSGKRATKSSCKTRPWRMVRCTHVNWGRWWVSMVLPIMGIVVLVLRPPMPANESFGIVRLYRYQSLRRRNCHCSR